MQRFVYVVAAHSVAMRNCIARSLGLVNKPRVHVTSMTMLLHNTSGACPARCVCLP